nr:hypothetical protein [Kibdelosporangium sp. MJ126-NF4]
MGPVTRVVLRGFALLIWLAGPALLLVGLLTEEQVPKIAGGVMTLLGLPLGMLVWRTVSRHVAEIRRLDQAGVPATAEVVEALQADTDDTVSLKLTLRISGPGFDAFEETIECADEPELRAGARLTAKVDPSDRLFMIIR